MSLFLSHVRKFSFPKTAIRTRTALRKKSENASGSAFPTFTPFMEMIDQRRNEANRSIVVQVQSSQSYKELYTHCSTFGVVKNMFHYTVGVEPMNFIIVEFDSPQEVQHVFQDTTFLDDSHIVPVQSHFLWFKASNRKLPKLKQSKTITLAVENGTRIAKEHDILTSLKNCGSISDQMTMLYNSTKLNDVGVRLRFLTAKQIESCLQGMFPNCEALPFGSSVNGTGKMGCDLDLVLRLATDNKNQAETRLVYHCKASQGSERMIWQRNMEIISDLIQLFLPGCSDVRRILQARVPIIKYCQHLTDVDCDLSMTNLSGVYMSDFLYIMGCLDPRIRPLIFTVRKWASAVGITNSTPGRWITNFSLTLMVLAFAQNPPNSAPILPTLNHLVQYATSADKYITEDGINCTFVRDINRLRNFPMENTNSLESLLVEFFQYCSEFDYEKKAICLNDLGKITKPEHCAIYIVNPLERGLNVSKNVSLEELERFRMETRNAAWILESQERDENWGILALFESRKRFISSKRIMEVCTLFTDEETSEKVESRMEYKNPAVKKQVEQIKEQHKTKLEELQKSVR